MYRLSKRGFDLFFSFVILLLTSPIFIIFSIAIKFESEGPILFKQRRSGKNGEEFVIYKFRSMKTNTPELATDKLASPQKYITKVGAFMRKTSIDELPQLLNIIKGDMSLVGPRPALYNQYELIEARTKCGVYTLFPGITGYAQIMGRDFISDEQKVAYDNYYKENMSLALDLKILYKTLFKVFRAEDVKA